MNELTQNLMTIVDNAENEVASLRGISNAEVTALLIAFQIQRDLIPSIVENANSIFETTPSGGRTKGFSKKLGRYIGSVVVSMAAGAVIGGVIGVYSCPLRVRIKLKNGSVFRFGMYGDRKKLIDQVRQRQER